MLFHVLLKKFLTDLCVWVLNAINYVNVARIRAHGLDVSGLHSWFTSFLPCDATFLLLNQPFTDGFKYCIFNRSYIKLNQYIINMKPHCSFTYTKN